MDLIIYVLLGILEITFIIIWWWVSRTVSKTLKLLDHSTQTAEIVSKEVHEVAKDLAKYADEIEKAKQKERNSPKNRRKGDRQDN